MLVIVCRCSAIVGSPTPFPPFDSLGSHVISLGLPTSGGETRANCHVLIVLLQDRSSKRRGCLELGLVIIQEGRVVSIARLIVGEDGAVI